MNIYFFVNSSALISFLTKIWRKEKYCIKIFHVWSFFEADVFLLYISLNMEVVKSNKFSRKEIK